MKKFRVTKKHELFKDSIITLNEDLTATLTINVDVNFKIDNYEIERWLRIGWIEEIKPVWTDADMIEFAREYLDYYMSTDNEDVLRRFQIFKNVKNELG